MAEIEEANNVFEVKYNASQYPVGRVLSAFILAPPIGTFMCLAPLSFFSILTENSYSVIDLLSKSLMLSGAITFICAFIYYPFMLFVGVPTIIFSEFSRQQNVRLITVFFFYLTMGGMIPWLIAPDFLAVFFLICGVSTAFISFIIMFRNRDNISPNAD